MQLISYRKMVWLVHERFLVDDTAHCKMIFAVIHWEFAQHLLFFVIDLQNVN